jgi:acid phosphatase type 7
MGKLRTSRRVKTRLLVALGLLIALIVVSAVASIAWARSRTAADPVMVGAGDIADCNSPGAAATAKLVDRIPGTVFTLGDNAYPGGTAKEFAECYDATWGRFKDRTRPAAGNHDYVLAGARAYYDYFGPAAGDPMEGYYSYDLGTWHIIVLNSDCAQMSGCKEGSPQEQWLRADLAAHPAECTLAYWHHPLFGSSGPHSANVEMQPIWWDLYRAGADVVLNGHAHNYERLAPLDPKGVLDPKRGIREFIVGTGGRDHRKFSKIMAASEARNSDTFGVLKLTLHPGSYDWEFVPETGKTFTDSGSAACH